MLEFLAGAAVGWMLRPWWQHFFKPILTEVFKEYLKNRG